MNQKDGADDKQLKNILPYPSDSIFKDQWAPLKTIQEDFITKKGKQPDWKFSEMYVDNIQSFWANVVWTDGTKMNVDRPTKVSGLMLLRLMKQNWTLQAS